MCSAADLALELYDLRRYVRELHVVELLLERRESLLTASGGLQFLDRCIQTGNLGLKAWFDHADRWPRARQPKWLQAECACAFVCLHLMPVLCAAAAEQLGLAERAGHRP